jgi:alpha-tubulin suppressor-like RCC1 family protein
VNHTGDGVGVNGCQIEATAVNVYADGTASCALGANKRVYCWGKGANNTFGDGSAALRTEATIIDGIDDAVMLGQGDADHACVVAGDKTVQCWGLNSQGQLGDGTTLPRLGPVRVSNLRQVVDVAHGGGATCAVHESGSVSCWGAGWVIGDSTNNAHQTTPVQLPNLSDVIKLRMTGKFACALGKSGSLYCWGDLVGDLGITNDPTMQVFVSKPSLVTTARDIRNVMVGPQAVCGFLSPSNVRCWVSP